MPRPLRIEYAGAWYHVMNRGANRQSIFETNQHRNMMLALLDELTERFFIEIHAFCFMDNHYHLLIHTPEGNLRCAMKHLNGIYTQRFNKLTGRDGPLFRGRYKAILIEDDKYILNVSRYIHLNPIEAGMCDHPGEYRWSSFQGYATNKPMTWLCKAFILNLMNGEDKQKLYSEFVMLGNDAETKNFYGKRKLSSIVGGDQFVKGKLNSLDKSYKENVLTDYNHTRRIIPIEIIISTVADYFHISTAEVTKTSKGKRNVARLIAILVVKKFGHCTQHQVSSIFENIKPRSISGLVRQYAEAVNKDELLKLHFERVCKCLFGLGK